MQRLFRRRNAVNGQSGMIVPSAWNGESAPIEATAP